MKFCKITKTPLWEPYNPASTEPVDSFEMDIYNDGDVFDNTNDYMDDSVDQMNFYREESDSEERIDPEKPPKEDKDSDYVASDDSGTVYEIVQCSKGYGKTITFESCDHKP